MYYFYAAAWWHHNGITRRNRLLSSLEWFNILCTSISHWVPFKMETAALHGKSTEFLHLQKAILPATFGFGPSTHFFLKNSVVEFQRLSSEFWTQWAWELSHLKSILKVNMWLACVELFGLGLNETRLEDLKCCQGVHDASRCMMPAGAWC